MAETQITHVFVTKYWQGGSIPRVQVLQQPDESGYLRVRWAGGYNGACTFSKAEYALTEAAALLQVGAKRAKKIKSLQKQIEKLQKFDVVFQNVPDAVEEAEDAE